jgi:hypothetical protein
MTSIEPRATVEFTIRHEAVQQHDPTSSGNQGRLEWQPGQTRTAAKGGAGDGPPR